MELATLIAILKEGSVYAIAAAGLTFVLLCAEIDLAVGTMALWGGCFSGWLYVNWSFFRWWVIVDWCGLQGIPIEQWQPGPGATQAVSIAALAMVVLLPLLSCLVLGFISGILTVVSRLPSFIITLAMMYIAEGTAKYVTQSASAKMPEFLRKVGNEGVQLWDVADSPGEGLVLPYIAILAGVVLLVGHLVLQHTRFGRYIYMTGGNREAARLAGVRTNWIVVACLTICAVTAGLGGIVNAGRIGTASLNRNSALLISAVACVVLGGTSLFGGEGSMFKTLVGVTIFTVLEAGFNRVVWIDDLARDLLTGVVLMAVLVMNGVLAQRGKT